MVDFTLYTIESAPEASKPLLRAIEKKWHLLPNLYRTLAESPVALEACDTLMTLADRTSLSPAERQVAFVAVSVLNECEYCTSGHSAFAKRAGVPEESIEALRNSTPIAEARLQALRLFAEAVVRERGFVGNAAIDRFLAAGFTKAQILEVITIVATKTLSNYVDHIAHVPLDDFMARTKWFAPPRNERES